MKRKIFKIDGSKGSVVRDGACTNMQTFWAVVVTEDGVVEMAPDNPTPQFLMIMLIKNCVLYILTSKLESGKEYKHFVGTLILVFNEDGRDKLTVLTVESDSEGIIDSFYLKLQHRDEQKLITIARDMVKLWIDSSGGRLIKQAKTFFLETTE